MKKLYTLPFFLFVFVYAASSQNIGIGTPTPVEKLDVNGNINVNGTIKVNGVDGSAGQVLMKNNAGTLVWGNPEEFKNFVSFVSGSGNWTIPAGVTKVYIEAWGGGGGGSWYAGGGGGGYVCGIITVTPGASVSYAVGAEGTGGGANGGNGVSSSVTYTPSSAAYTANGGFGATLNTGIVFPGSGGPFAATGTISFAGVNGMSGHPSIVNIVQSSATAFFETCTGGHGGDGANFGGKGGRGGYYVFNNSTLGTSRASSGSNGSRPGGGGGAGYIGTITTAGFFGGSSGGSGMVVIRY
jgi:hypothetical protein